MKWQSHNKNNHVLHCLSRRGSYLFAGKKRHPGAFLNVPVNQAEQPNSSKLCQQGKVCDTLWGPLVTPTAGKAPIVPMCSHSFSHHALDTSGARVVLVLLLRGAAQTSTPSWQHGFYCSWWQPPTCGWIQALNIWGNGLGEMGFLPGGLDRAAICRV